ncbi:MAG: nucleotidyl transferase [Burkholderiaceae bacterium]|jgi:glucose-1-phosphate cytidylyltransferase|uniref:sugar phosphate nucleotidyltransferase n=1 Tax=Ottowia thiooxydans TaxID=219182 RepID=UPI0004079FAE|nr:sugar phosphate nucleotidyltransferase [Ottowia thiooxydans]TXH35877.1 MAG: nucleotidyl transferase [Burkholderiaceae bacterium]
MQVVILAGGKGTRAYPFTDYLPKPMMPVGGKPILVQIMQLFAAQGHREFILSIGHRKEVILDYFADKDNDLDITIVNTGEDTDTAGRIYKCRHLLRDQFMATYGDGLCDVPMDKLIAFHNSHGGLATLTSVPLQSQYGTVEYDAQDRVTGFKEKPRLNSHWINAGFFVMNKGVFDHWEGSNLEREVYPKLLEKGLLYTYRHDGFFKSMDTYKDQQEMEELLSTSDLVPRANLTQTNKHYQYFDHLALEAAQTKKN